MNIVLPDGRICETQVADIRRLRDSLRHRSGLDDSLDRKLGLAEDTDEQVELSDPEALALRKAIERLSGDPHSAGVQQLYRDVTIALRAQPGGRLPRS